MPDRHAFLAAAGWGEARAMPLNGDASTRSYARLVLGGRTAMLMDQPQGAEPAAAPPDADEGARAASGYNATARLAGADCRRFAAVARYLRARGFSAPAILAADYRQGLVLTEDLGDGLFTELIARGHSAEEELYLAAVEVLAGLHAEPAPRSLPFAPGIAQSDGEVQLPLFPYDAIALIAETDLMLEWFLPLALGRRASESECQEHRALWRSALKEIEKGQPVLVHRDYHAQNLLWLPERKGPARVGLIDFQDAVAGSRAYDLVSLIEDARRDVPAALAAGATRHYLTTVHAQGVALDEPRFRAEMALMAAQRNTKIVGIFARLHVRDGKQRYLDYLPRVWAYLENDLSHPLLAGLEAWYERVLPRARRRLPAGQPA
ncbi:MAG: aminoglycoside phosphotransferase family protein [Rhizomicrobium sp.]